jgi:ABC-type antimicrobial peptide transport system permease subunit
MPIFWLGIMLIIIFAVRLRLLPASGYGTWQNFVMPAFCLGAFLAPITMRLVRSGIIEVMNMEFIKTARAKGLGERMVVIKHAFRNACIPVITVLGLQFGQLDAPSSQDGVRLAGRRPAVSRSGLSGGPVRRDPARAAHRRRQPDRRSSWG